MKAKFILFSALSFSLSAVFAQSVPGEENAIKGQLLGHTTRVDDNWVWYKPDFQATTDNFFKQFGDALGLSSQDEMRLHRKWEEKSGVTHFHYKQFHRGIEVENAEYALQVRGGRIIVSNGYVAKNVSLSTTINIQADEALERATEKLKFKKYAWESSDMQASLKKSKDDLQATWLPEAQLIYADINLLSSKPVLSKFKLAYKFEITGADPFLTHIVYVDCVDGSILKDIPQGKQCFSKSDVQSPMDYNPVAGTFIPLHGRYGSLRNFTCFHELTDWNGYFGPVAVYNLRSEPEKGIETKSWQGNTFLDGANPTRISLPPYSAVEWGTNSQDATTAHWVIQRAYDYYRDSFGRNGLNGVNDRIGVFVNWDQYSNGVHISENNAQYDFVNGFPLIKFGLTSGGADVVSVDIGAHEYTHGVIRNTSNLAYQGLSGALNESFADMFGTAVENFALGSSNWLVGEDVFGGGIRNMQNPNNNNQPEVVGGNFWIPVDGCSPNQGNDYCFVHRNSGVPNRWFALLANSQGIGTASTVAYNTLQALISSSNFNDARNASIQVASNLFGGACNNVVQAVTNAWATVGVGNTFICGGRLAAMEEPHKFTVYPNPTSDVLHIDLQMSDDDRTERVYTLYHLDGRKLIETHSSEHHLAIDVKALKSGLYILSATSIVDGASEELIKKKIIIHH